MGSRVLQGARQCLAKGLHFLLGGRQFRSFLLDPGLNQRLHFGTSCRRSQPFGNRPAQYARHDGQNIATAALRPRELTEELGRLPPSFGTLARQQNPYAIVVASARTFAGDEDGDLCVVDNTSRHTAKQHTPYRPQTACSHGDQICAICSADLTISARASADPTIFCTVGRHGSGK